MRWNLGDILDTVATVVPPERPAIVQGETSISWRQLDQRSNRVARAMVAAGLAPGARVAFLSRNHPAYIEGFVACLKARLMHVNVNYRYLADEIDYVLMDSATSAVLFQREFAPVIAELRARRPGIAHWICADSPADAPATVAFEDWATAGDGSPLDIVRTGDDAFLMYTGGTTGRPKGVIWAGDAVRRTQMESPVVRAHPATLAEHADMVRGNTQSSRVLPACPLMHGAGITSSLAELLGGGTVALLPSARFDAVELWDTVERHRVTRILIVGDVFARPMLQALDTADRARDLESLKLISSSGVMWSREVKQGLLRHLPWLSLVDILGASEGSGLGYSITTREREPPTGRFQPGARTVLISEDGRVLGANESGPGMLARDAPLPVGYLNDPAKTAAVFPTIGGVRYSIPGDWAERHADGTMSLIGRGNLVINTGGEKVFIEEVESALQTLPMIEDAMVVGLPDADWGATVVALVRQAGAAPLDLAATRDALRPLLAGYKIPRLIFAVPDMPRAASGKGDYRSAKTLAAGLRAGQGMPA